MNNRILQSHPLGPLHIEIHAHASKEIQEGWKYGMVAIHAQTKERLLCFDNSHGYPHIDRSLEGKNWTESYFFVDIWTAIDDFYREAHELARRLDRGI